MIASETVSADRAYGPLGTLAKLLDSSVLAWRPVNPPGLLVCDRAHPDRCLIVVVVDGWYAKQPATRDQPPVLIEPIARPQKAATYVAWLFGFTPQEQRPWEIPVSRVLDDTPCGFADCTEPAAASVVIGPDRAVLRCLFHWPETHAGLTRRGYLLTSAPTQTGADGAAR